MADSGYKKEDKIKFSPNIKLAAYLKYVHVRITEHQERLGCGKFVHNFSREKSQNQDHGVPGNKHSTCSNR